MSLIRLLVGEDAQHHGLAPALRDGSDNNPRLFFIRTATSKDSVTVVPTPGE